MTTEELAFLDALRLNPADATCRLVYADWLADHDRFVDEAVQRVCARPADDGPRLQFADCCERAGDEARAEFTRVQVELARLGVLAESYRPMAMIGADGSRKTELLRRQEQFWGKKIHDVLLTVGDSTYYTNPHNQVWRRGFVEEVNYPADAFLEIAGELLLRHPVTRVRLTSLPGVECGPLLQGAEDARECRLIGGSRDQPADKTKWVRVSYLTNAGQAIPRIVKGVMERCWPGVEFELAGTPPASGTGTGGHVTVNGVQLPVTGWQFTGPPAGG